MKKTIYCVLGVLVILIGIWTIGTGFRKETTAFVDDFSLNDDNSTMTIHADYNSNYALWLYCFDGYCFVILEM